jgi:hypothetical protein
MLPVGVTATVIPLAPSISFDLALHPWYESMELAFAAARKANVRIAAPIIGQWNEPEQLPEVKIWWRGQDKVAPLFGG